ncbi:hypothetical protein B0H13DRAFT_2560182 [Mycena leptocephala]|nr:hypothetical protein B0H13DRAFT_2560182 [Mycena leptocephala]
MLPGIVIERVRPGDTMRGHRPLLVRKHVRQRSASFMRTLSGPAPPAPDCWTRPAPNMQLVSPAWPKIHSIARGRLLHRLHHRVLPPPKASGENEAEKWRRTHLHRILPVLLIRDHRPRHSRVELAKRIGEGKRMRRGRDEDETTCSVGAETIQRAGEYPIPTASELAQSEYNPCTTNELSQARAGRRSASLSRAPSDFPSDTVGQSPARAKDGKNTVPGRDADRPRRHLPRTKHTASAYSVKRPRTRLPHRPHAIAPPSYASEWQSPQERDAASPTPAAQARRPELCTRHPRVAPQRTHPRAAQKAIKTEKQSKKREGAYRSPPLPFLKTAARIVDGSKGSRSGLLVAEAGRDSVRTLALLSRMAVEGRGREEGEEEQGEVGETDGEGARLGGEGGEGERRRSKADELP